MTPGWSASESRIVEPYLRADDLLHGVRFRCSPTSKYEEDENYWFDRDSLPEEFRPSFELALDGHEVADAADIPIGDLRAVIVVRDRARKRWHSVVSWPLSDIPASADLALDSNEFALGRRMEFVLMVTPASRIPRREGRAFRPDQVIAARSFHVNLRRDGNRFSVSTLPPEWFEENGMSKDTVWALDWNTRDPYLEPVSTLTVVINDRFSNHLQRAVAGEAGGEALAAQIAADVFVEASMVAIENADDFETERTTLLGSVLAGLGIDNSEDFDSLKELVSDDSGRVSAMSFVRGRAQASVGLARVLLRTQSGGLR